MTPPEMPYSVVRRNVNGLQLEMAIAGDVGRPLIILLHGFPDLWQGWHFQIPSLQRAGYRIVAPNLRGYGSSDKPAGVANYDLDRLAEDITLIADSESAETFGLVGHDWGGIIAWWVSANYPERVSRLAILNAPHPGVFKKFMLKHPIQALRSWYIAFFQLPWLPEFFLSVMDYKLLYKSVKGTSQRGTFDDTDRKYLVEGWSKPGALTAMLNYYRSIARKTSRSLQKRISVPTLIQFGKRDPTEEPGLAKMSLGMCDNARIELFERSKHWIQREEHDRVSKNLIAFFSKTS